MSLGFVLPTLIGVALIALMALLTAAPPASAHTGFESSNPGDGQTIDQPVAEISLSFSGEATPTGDGFVVLDPSGQTREPNEVLTSRTVSISSRSWTSTMTPPRVRRGCFR